MTTYRTGRHEHRCIRIQLGAEPHEDDPLIGTMDTPELGRLVVELLNGATVVRTVSGTRQVTDATVRDVARVYREHIGANPTKAVQAHLGVAERTARLYVRRARDAGHLGPAVPGKATL